MPADGTGSGAARRRRLRAALCAALIGGGLATSTSAQEPGPDAREIAASDSLEASAGVADTSGAASASSRIAQPSSRGGFFRSPTGIMLRSLVVPGWGQATNGEWVKAGVVAAAEGYFIYTLIRDSDRLRGLEPGTPEYVNLENQRNANAWWLGGVVLLSMVDAYVGAHLRGIEVRIGPEPETQSVRVGLQREF